MLKIDLQILLRKTLVRLNLKIDLGSLHISPGAGKFNPNSVFEKEGKELSTQ